MQGSLFVQNKYLAQVAQQRGYRERRSTRTSSVQVHQRRKDLGIARHSAQLMHAQIVETTRSQHSALRSQFSSFVAGFRRVIMLDRRRLPHNL